MPCSRQQSPRSVIKQAQTASPDKGQINSGTTDNSQLTSPRRWAECRDGNPTAVWMTSPLLHKLSTWVSFSQPAFHFRTNCWVSEPYRDLQTGSYHYKALPGMNGRSDHCKTLPGKKGGSDHRKAPARTPTTLTGGFRSFPQSLKTVP